MWPKVERVGMVYFIFPILLIIVYSLRPYLSHSGKLIPPTVSKENEQYYKQELVSVNVAPAVTKVII